MKISIPSYSFHGLAQQKKMDIYHYLESVKYHYRVDAADIWNGMLVSTEEEYLKEIRAAMDEKELVLANLCVDGAHVWDENPEERERLHQNALAHLKAAQILGAKTVRIDMGGQNKDMSEEQFEFTVQRYGEYVHIAKESGFRVGPENHWGSARYLQNMKRLFETVNDPTFGLLLHFDNWEEEMDTAHRTCAKWAMHTHIASWVVPTAEEKMKVLMDAGYDGYWGVEHHSGENEYNRVEWQLAAIKMKLINLSKSQSK